MKKMMKFTSLQRMFSFVMVLALTTFALSSCRDDEPDPGPQSNLVTDVVANDGRFSTLLAALNQAGLTSALAGSGPFTVFAPTDEAFAAYLSANNLTPQELLGSPALADILRYHVISGASVTSGQLTNGGVETLNGAEVFVNVNSGVVLNGNIRVTSADITTDNGVIHIIDNVLIPPTDNIAALAAGNANLSRLVGLLQQFELVDALSGAGPFTVFAPTNAAFDAIESVLPTLSDAEIRDILLYHVVGARAFSVDLTAGPLQTLNVRKRIDVAVSGNAVTLNGSANVATANILATNGVVHVVNEVLLPRRTVVDVALYNPNFSSLVAALTKANLVGALDEGTNLTVFAPTNTAFNAAITSLGFSGVDDPTLTAEILTPILTYHVLGLDAPATSSMLVDNKFYPTLNGGGIQFRANGLNLRDARGRDIPLVADLLNLEESNGVVHVINGVLLPPNQTIVEIALAQDPEFTTLVSLLQRAELVETLSGQGPFTVFAPTNQAFTDLGIDPDDLTDEQLTNILLYHVTAGRVFSTDLTNGQQVRSLFGENDFTININGNVTITDGNADSPDAGVVSTDIQGTNGIIHVINRVILPQ
jgi:transforming growth factor-beta-induced protein